MPRYLSSTSYLMSQGLRTLSQASGVSASVAAHRQLAAKTGSSATASSTSRRLHKPVIFVCDIQEKFRNAIWEFDKVVAITNKMLKAASVLSIPVVATTQNAAGLGSMVSEVQEHLNKLATIPRSKAYNSHENGVSNGTSNGVTSNIGASDSLLLVDEDKTKFSMWLPSVAAQLQGGSHEIAIVGIESHVCVTHTVLDALAAGHRVYVIADAVSSCNREEVAIALRRLAKAGATITTSESWLYEVMGGSGIVEFKKMVGLVKETSADTKKALGALCSSKL